MGFQSSTHAVLKATDPARSSWSLTLFSGKIIHEHSLVFDFRAGGLRMIDWSLDIVSTGDIYKIKDVTLHCPDKQSASFVIDEPGTVFQLKIASMTVLAQGHAMVQAHLIGKVINKETGTCACHIWDRELGLFSFLTNVYNFGSWRPGILPLGKLSCDVLGLRM